jgi:hypothetical protein
MLFAGLLGVAYGWEPAEQRTLPSPVPITGIAAIDVGGNPWFLVTGPGGTALVDGRGAVRGRIDDPAFDVAISQYDDRVVAYLCGGTGVQSVAVTSAGLAAAELAFPGRCGAILKVAGTGSEPAALLIAGDGVTRVPIEKSGLGAPIRLDERAFTDPLMARAGDRIALAERGATEVTELGPWGRSSFRTEGPISGLAYGSEGVAWTVTVPPSTGDATRRTVALADSPESLRTAAIAGPNASDRVVLHTGDPVLYGIIPRNSTEQVRVAPKGAKALLVDDVNLDGCVDIVVGGTTEISWSIGQCEAMAIPASRAAPDEIPKPTPIIMNGEIPSITARVGEEFWGQLYFPDGKRRSWSARGYPDGMLVLPDGLVRYTPTNDQVGRHEIYVRGGSVTQKLAIVVLPGDHEPEVQLLPPVGEAPEQPKPPSPRACMVGLGVAAGASYAVEDWRRVGSGPIAGSGSPAAMIACDSGQAAVRGFFGFDTAPTFSYYAGSETPLPHLAALTAGVTFGGRTLRAGPYGTIGLVILGVGLRTSWTPFKGPTPEASRGFELRITAFTPSTPAGEAMLFWVWRG